MYIFLFASGGGVIIYSIGGGGKNMMIYARKYRGEEVDKWDKSENVHCTWGKIHFGKKGGGAKSYFFDNIPPRSELKAHPTLLSCF